jgi:hypothetical protein
MAATVSFPPEFPQLKSRPAVRRQAASERLLAALLILLFAASLISIGICLDVIVQTATTIKVVTQDRAR